MHHYHRHQLFKAAAVPRRIVSLVVLCALTLFLLGRVPQRPVPGPALFTHDLFTDHALFSPNGYVYQAPQAHLALTVDNTPRLVPEELLLPEEAAKRRPHRVPTSARVFTASPAPTSVEDDRPGWAKFRPVVPVEGRDYRAPYNVTAVSQDAPCPKPSATFLARHKARDPSALLFSYLNRSTTRWPVRVLAVKPRVVSVPQFLSDVECDALIEAARTQLSRSQVAPHKGSKASHVQDIRTSSQAWLPSLTGIAAPVVARVLDLVGFPESSAEALQILRYEEGQHYSAHHDYFDPELYGKQRTNRAVTVFMYLNTVEEGGETQFPRAGGRANTGDYGACRGLKVRPRRGSLAIFYDMTPFGELDPFSLHGGCDVVKGTKWGGTLWLHLPTPE